MDVNISDSFELILIIFGTVFTFFFLIWASSQLVRFIPTNRFDFKLRLKSNGRFFK